MQKKCATKQFTKYVKKKKITKLLSLSQIEPKKGIRFHRKYRENLENYSQKTNK